MKKLFILMSVAAFTLASCGDASGDASGDSKKSTSSAVCDCIDTRVDMMKDIMNGMSDEDAEAKYSESKKACQALGEGKTPEELDALNKEAEACASNGELEKLQEQLMQKMMSEEMLDQGLDAMEEEMK